MFKHIIIIIFIIIKIIGCIELYFQPDLGSWDDVLNWDPNSIPTINDEAYINKMDEQYCQAIENDITALGVQVGSESVYSYLYSNVSALINTFIVLNGQSQALFTSRSNQNISTIVTLNFVLANQSSVGVSSIDQFNNNFIIVDDGGYCGISNSIFNLQDISQRSYSFISIQNSNGIIKNGTNGFINRDYSTFLFKSTDVNIFNDILFQGSYFNLTDYSNVKLYCNNEKSIHWDPLTIPDNDTIQAFGSYIDFESSNFFSDKVYINLNNINDFKSSIITFNNTYTSYNSWLFLNSGILIFNAPVFLFQESLIFVTYGSKAFFNSQVLQYDNSSLSFYSSEVIIDAKSYNYELRLSSTFMVYEGSTLKINSNFTNYDSVQVAINGSVVSVLGSLNCFDTSAFAAIDSTVHIENDFILHDSTLMAYLRSNISISGSHIFNNNSGFIFESSIVNIDGSFLDFRSDNSINSGFYNGLINVNGLFHSYGNLVIVESNVKSYNQLLLKGRIVITNSTFIIENGNFDIYGELYSLNSIFILENGFILIHPSSYFNAKDSSFTLLNGQLLIGSNSTFKFTNSTLYNSNKGTVNAKGDITLESNGYIQNNADMNLYSSILLQIDSSSLPTGNESISNNGKLIILQSSSSGSSGSSNGGDNETTNIMVPLFNSGKIIINSKSVNTLQFKQSDGGELSIINSTLNSNNTINIDNSFISGIGLINSTSIEFNNATIGNNQNNDNIVTILNITGEFKSNKDQLHFIIQSELNTTLINIQNIATINNSTLVIKINKDNQMKNKNITLMNFDQLNGNGFDSIKFKYYDPVSGKELDQVDSCKYKTTLNSKSVVLLIGGNECSNNKLSTGAIIGIVIGSAAFIILISIFIKVKSNWLYLKYYTAKEASIKLKSKFTTKG